MGALVKLLIQAIKMALKRTIKRTLIKNVLKGVKEKIVSPFKFVKGLVLDPKAVVKKRFTKPVRRAKSKYKKARKLGRLTRFALSPKARAIEETTKNALLMNSINEEINITLAKRTSAERATSEIVQQISAGNKVLNQLKIDEIRSVNKTILKELSGVGADSQIKIAELIEKEEAREQLVKTAAYETFMDNWKDGFFAYKPEEMGMSEEEQQDVWNQIEAEQTPEHVIDRKFND